MAPPASGERRGIPLTGVLGRDASADDRRKAHDRVPSSRRAWLLEWHFRMFASAGRSLARMAPVSCRLANPIGRDQADRAVCGGASPQRATQGARGRRSDVARVSVVKGASLVCSVVATRAMEVCRMQRRPQLTLHRDAATSSDCAGPIARTLNVSVFHFATGAERAVLTWVPVFAARCRGSRHRV